jgi:hypothetical protein
VRAKLRAGTGSEESAPFRAEILAWLAERLGLDVARMPGTHLPYLDRPRELAEAIRPLLALVSEP